MSMFVSMSNFFVPSVRVRALALSTMTFGGVG